MTIFSKIAKYEYLQYEYFSKKIVIFDFKNMTKKKPMAPDELPGPISGGTFVPENI